eukprot:scaffold323284_cov41-Tisochrysis_lutea.AAC.1
MAEATEGPCIAEAVQNFLSVLMASELSGAEGVEHLSLPQLQNCARTFLQAVNTVPLPDGFSPPDGVKASRVFGRSLLTTSGLWESVRDRCLRRDTPLDGLEGFLHSFHRSFVDGVVEEHEVELGKLVWASDFAAVLHERGMERRARAKARAEDAEDGMDATVTDVEQAHDELKELVQAQLGQ